MSAAPKGAGTAKQSPKGKRRGGFQKGQQANPRGRPPAGMAISELFRDYLTEEDRVRRVPRIQALAAKLYAMSMTRAGNPSAARALLEWSIAKPMQRVEYRVAEPIRVVVVDPPPRVEDDK